MKTAYPHALVSSDVTEKFTTKVVLCASVRLSPFRYDDQYAFFFLKTMVHTCINA